MDADSSYGGSDTTQDSALQENHTDLPQDQKPNTINNESSNQFYHKNEITLPVNMDEVDFHKSKLELKPTSPKLPHYKSTANINVNEEENSNLEQNKSYTSTSKLNESPKAKKKQETAGIDNPAFQNDPEKSDPYEDKKSKTEANEEKKLAKNGDLNTSASLGLKSPTKDNNSEQMTEAVNLELVNLKPLRNGETHENGGSETHIPVKKQTAVDIGEPYDEYFVPVNEYRKNMR